MGKFETPDKILLICTGSKCGKRGGKNFYKIASAWIKSQKLQKAEVLRMECTDRCKFAPVCALIPENIWWKEYTERDTFGILNKLSK